MSMSSETIDLQTLLQRFSFINKVAPVPCSKSSLSSRMVYRSFIKTLSAKGKSDKEWRVNSRRVLPLLSLCLRFELNELLAGTLTSACKSNSDS